MFSWKASTLSLQDQEEKNKRPKDVDRCIEKAFRGEIEEILWTEAFQKQ